MKALRVKLKEFRYSGYMMLAAGFVAIIIMLSLKRYFYFQQMKSPYYHVS